MVDRYLASPDFEGLWAVIDGFSYLPATFEGRRLVMLDKLDAKALADRMNDLYRKKQSGEVS